MAAKLIIVLCRWGRWTDVLTHGQFRKGWRELDVEDCARVIVSSAVCVWCDVVTKLVWLCRCSSVCGTTAETRNSRASCGS